MHDMTIAYRVWYKMVYGCVTLLLVCVGLSVSFHTNAQPDLQSSTTHEVSQPLWHLKGQSRHGHYRIFMRPLSKDIPLRVYHKWLLFITTKEGQPVSFADIIFDGGMPAHQHGLPSTPSVKAIDRKGRYLIEGLQFNMGGHWVLDIKIAHQYRDTVRFDLMLEP